VTASEQLALFVLAIWSGVLTIVVILTVRQVALLSLRPSGQAVVNMDDLGPKAGMRVPAELDRFLAEYRDVQAIVLISAVCGPCRELAKDFTRLTVSNRFAFLVTGSSDDVADMVSLVPPGAVVLTDPDASRLARSLGITSTPFGVGIAGDQVSRSKFLRSIEDVETLTSEYVESSPLDAAITATR
jgi:hypothetical protein